MGRKQRLGHFKLGRQVLLGGRVVHDHHVAQRSAAPLGMPFLAEHGHERRLDRRWYPFRGGWMDATAHAVGTGQRRVEQGAARVAVDLDQLGAIGRQVKVVAHEDPRRPPVELCNRVGPGQGLGLPGRQGYDPFQCVHRLHQLGVDGLVQKHGGGRKQVGVALGQPVRHALQRRAGFQLFAQALGLQRLAGAGQVERVGGAHGVVAQVLGPQPLDTSQGSPAQQCSVR